MREILLMAAVLAPWAALGGILYGGLMILERKPAGSNRLLWLLAAHACSTAGLFFGPYVLRQFGLEFRCLPKLFLIAAWLLSGVGMIVAIIMLCFRQKQTRWLERGGILLSGVMLLGISLYCSFIFTALTLQTEKIGLWNGEQVVMVAVEGIGHRCYAHHGPVVMGEYLGTAFAE